MEINLNKCMNIIGILLFVLFLIYGCSKGDNLIEPLKID